MSGFTLEEFKNKFKDLARPNRFKVFFYPDGDIGDTLTTMVKKVNMPQISMQEFVYERAGKKLHIPTHAEFADLSITFFNEDGHALKRFFHNWQKKMVVDWVENTLPSPLIALSGRIEVYQYDYNNEPSAGMRFTNCWPKNISNLDFGHDYDNTVSDFTIDFTYTNQEVIVL